MGSDRILFITVGTGDIERLEESLFVPLRKSIRKGEWQEVVLLPSQETARTASQLRDELADLRIVMEPLPQPDLENNADQSYAHFERVIAERITAGTPAEQMVVDFTRGTKAMSAALLLAASRHGIARLRYIAGQRCKAGSVIAGTEELHEFRTTVSSGHRLLDQARLLMEQGNFAAVLTVLPDPDTPMAALWPGDVLELSRFGQALAAFYGAWDRLDYAEAGTLLGQGLPPCPDPQWERLMPDRAAIGHVRSLAAPMPEKPQARADWVQARAVDLLANGERRIWHKQFEDAYLRAYRVLELVGQARLFAHGLDSSQLPPEHSAVQTLKDKLKEHEGGFGIDRKTKNYTAARELTARLLKVLDDPMGSRLLKLGEGSFVKARNRSLLIHGFTATSLSSGKELQAIYADLEKLLLKDADQSVATLAAARTVPCGASGANPA